MLFVSATAISAEGVVAILAVFVGLIGVVIPLGVLTFAVGFALREYGATKFTNAFRSEPLPEKGAWEHITYQVTRLVRSVTFQSIEVAAEFAVKPENRRPTSDCP